MKFCLCMQYYKSEHCYFILVSTVTKMQSRMKGDFEGIPATYRDREDISVKIA